MTNEQRQTYIAGLLDELRACEVNGKASRAAAVRAELSRVGHEGAAPAKRAAASARKVEKR